MNEETVRSIVAQVIEKFQNINMSEKQVPIAVSARHVHLSKEHMQILFGKDYELTKKADLSQPGQYAANETLTIAGRKGSIERVRVLGPVRSSTQIEISQTDAVKMGYEPPVRQSGEILNSSPCVIFGPKGSLHIEEGLIIAQRHIHMNPEDANLYGVSDGDLVTISVKSERPIQFDQVLIRVSDRYKLEMHIDTDEANAAAIHTGNSGVLIKKGFLHNE
ncbi:phosphate propanoyltransferase [Fictibacillus fluitans]|uniref:Phosphate propanoyltransferase n=1 Tax=Fictibacillus fluitans TaxID=3058422 RepID=A0ABT8I0S6_9BACL|nr:phosphate propanoyltransferase [Fictibacillus sp. NE201]MDN4526631.1 phosphate propanoyltransferase [Fictibacillus sp. NE201]